MNARQTQSNKKQKIPWLPWLPTLPFEAIFAQNADQSQIFIDFPQVKNGGVIELDHRGRLTVEGTVLSILFTAISKHKKVNSWMKVILSLALTQTNLYL